VPLHATAIANTGAEGGHLTAGVAPAQRTAVYTTARNITEPSRPTRSIIDTEGGGQRTGGGGGGEGGQGGQPGGGARGGGWC